MKTVLKTLAYIYVIGCGLLVAIGIPLLIECVWLYFLTVPVYIAFIVYLIEKQVQNN
mgnify:CR=1 FL=1